MYDSVAEIKSRLSIEDLVRQYVQLKKTGRSLKGLCPFHAEKSPSFVVSPEKGMAYCFGCHKGGDIFKFVQEIEGIDFVDALKLLAERTGVTLKEVPIEQKVNKSDKDQLFQIHDVATAFYEKYLWETKDGEKVLDYLHKRGLTDETIKFFRIGFSPDSYEETYTMLLKKDFSKKTILSSGLAHSQETTADKIYDRFRGRLMFPISDHVGRIVGFGGRALKKDQEPKYLNSPETVIYHKSNVLYGFAQSKAGIRERKEVVLVEGYMDMIASYQAGIKYTVASSGTALTVQQLRLLKPYVDTLFFAFDMDNAGQEAAQRAFDLTHEFDFQVKVIELPDCKDIAEFAQNHVAELPTVLSNAASYGDYSYRKLIRTYGTDNIASKRKILQEFFPFLSQIKSNLEKDEYVRRFAHDLELKEVQIYDEIKNLKLPHDHPARTSRILDTPVTEAKKMLNEELFLGFVIQFPRIAKLFKNLSNEEQFLGDLKAIYKAFYDQYNTEGTVETAVFLASLPYELAEKATLLSIYIDEVYGEISEQACEKEMKLLIDKIAKKSSDIKGKELQRAILEAERSGDKETTNRLLEDLQKLNRVSA